MENPEMPDSETIDRLLPSVCAWAGEQERHILAAGVPLTAAQAGDAAQIGVQNPERVRVLRVPQVPHPDDPALAAAARGVGLFFSHTAGMALRYGIFLLDDLPDPHTTLIHELAHTAQYERLGGFEGFLRQYLTECLTVGYFGSALEQEAVNAAERLD